MLFQDVVDLIEDLESACIRFVHFSKENELRSRVFSEKMGLEAGWNCHISLLREPEEDQEVSPSQHDLSRSGSSSNRPSRYSSRHSTDSTAREHVLSDSAREHVLSKTKLVEDDRRGRRLSAPGAINLDTSQVKFEPTPCTLEVEYQGSSYQGQGHQSMNSAGADLLMDDCVVKIRNHSMGVDNALVDITEPLLTNNKGDDPTLNSEGQDLETDSMDVDGVALIDMHRSGISMDSQQGSSYVTENTDSVSGGLGLANRVRANENVGLDNTCFGDYIYL